MKEKLAMTLSQVDDDGKETVLKSMYLILPDDEEEKAWAMMLYLYYFDDLYAKEFNDDNWPDD